MTGRKRSPALPDVPTISETPGMAAYEMTLWLGVLAPAGTPEDIVARLHREIGAAMADARDGQADGRCRHRGACQ